MRQDEFYADQHATALLRSNKKQAWFIEQHLGNNNDLQALFALNRLLSQHLTHRQIDPRFQLRLKKDLLKVGRQQVERQHVPALQRPHRYRYWLWGAMIASLASVAGSLAYFLIWRHSSEGVAS